MATVSRPSSETPASPIEHKKKCCEGKEPLLIALGIIAVLGLLAAAIGLQSFGCHQGWWSQGLITPLHPAANLVFMGAGGGISIAALVTLVSVCAKRRESSDDIVEGNASSIITLEELPASPEQCETEAESEVLGSASQPMPLTTSLQEAWGSIDSGETTPCSYRNRKEFLEGEQPTHPPVIGASAFLSREMLDHLMRNKADSALGGVKYLEGTSITNGEGALHAFVTPIGLIHMTGDYVLRVGHSLAHLPEGKARQVILSAAVPPDFETVDVLMEMVSLKEMECQGIDYDLTGIPTDNEKRDPAFRAQYDARIREHLVFHLTESHSLPALDKAAMILSRTETIQLLEQGIRGDGVDLRNRFVRIDEERVISLEMLVNIYWNQLYNEISILDENLPQGYILTIDPPSQFAKNVKGMKLLNRLQILAFKSLEPKNLKLIAFSDYFDREALSLWETVFQNVTPKSRLFEGMNNLYSGPKGHALVVHSNGNAFGQDIETETGFKSMGAMIGQYSDAACVFNRQRPDLLDHVKQPDGTEDWTVLNPSRLDFSRFTASRA